MTKLSRFYEKFNVEGSQQKSRHMSDRFPTLRARSPGKKVLKKRHNVLDTFLLMLCCATQCSYKLLVRNLVFFCRRIELTFTGTLIAYIRSVRLDYLVQV